MQGGINMIKAESFINSALHYGFSFYTGVPCSLLTPFINHVIDDEKLHYVMAANEGEAVSIAAGAKLGGRGSVAIMQNSGLGNAVNPLTSLHAIFKIPILLIITWRGEPNKIDEPQHQLMGNITLKLLELMKINWAYFPSDEKDIEVVLKQAVVSMQENNMPFALVMKKGSVDSCQLNSRPKAKLVNTVAYRKNTALPLYTRQQILQCVQENATNNSLLIATTGYTGRELNALADNINQFYMVGSMGCASSLGLGLALAQPTKKIIVLDGDGALLMRMGALATIGYERPANLLHIVLDNQCHESTGGQFTVSDSVDFCSIAAACGYEHIVSSIDIETIKTEVMKTSKKLSFIHIRTKTGVPENLPRPDVTPEQVATRLHQYLNAKVDIK